MVGPLLETKFNLPRRRAGAIARPRLHERLDDGTYAALTLISAPAGFGKSTLIAEWLATRRAGETFAAWLTLDERDNDAALFWQYVVAALRTATSADFGAEAMALLQAGEAGSEAMLAALLNDCQRLSTQVVLVLDDYHAIRSPQVHDAVRYLLEHLPPRLQLVVASRADPPFPLAGYRARGDLIELRAAELRFSRAEAATYLNDAMALALTDDDLVALDDRAEGWIAALQLAALSMQRREDRGGFIAEFAGDDRYIVDYLVEEVLQGLPEQVRTFLLATSILRRLTGELCDAVTGQPGGTAMLRQLDKENLFVVPLDGRRHWYRYHHLFSDMLQARLLDEQPDSRYELHARASRWHEQEGDAEEAIRHALASRDYDRTAGLVELAIPAMRRNRQEAAFRAWIEALPQSTVDPRPVLGVGLVGILISSGELEQAEARLDVAERWLTSSSGDGGDRSTTMVVADEEGFRRLPGTIAMYRAALAHVRGDGRNTVAQARQALQLSPEDDHLNRAAAAGFLGLASWSAGDLDQAAAGYEQCMAGLGRAGHDADVLGAAVALGDIRIAQGRLSDAGRVYEQALRRALDGPGVVPRGTADLYVGMSEIDRQRNDLDAARAQLRRCDALGEHAGQPQHRHRRWVAMARLAEADGDLSGALELLAEAERRYDRTDFFPDTRPIEALRARLLLAGGNLRSALDWATQTGLSVDDEVSYVREFEHVTLCRLLVARSIGERDNHHVEDAVRLLERLLRDAEAGNRTGSLVDISLAQALAFHARGERDMALTAVRRAVAAAEAEGYVRVFLEGGAPVASLLAAVVKHSAGRSYARRLLSSFGTSAQLEPVAQDLVDPLSERELEVLRLLGTHLGGPDIARELVVSLNTVRTHTKHIYAKLGVNSRREAVHQARQLHLL